MPERHFQRGESTYFCYACHKETRDTGRGEHGTGLCHLCYTLSELENYHLDYDHEPEFALCKECRDAMTISQINQLPYYLGEKSYPTI
jgi:hypothetical protein